MRHLVARKQHVLWVCTLLALFWCMETMPCLVVLFALNIVLNLTGIKPYLKQIHKILPNGNLCYRLLRFRNFSNLTNVSIRVSEEISTMSQAELRFFKSDIKSLYYWCSLDENHFHQIDPNSVFSPNNLNSFHLYSYSLSVFIAPKKLIQIQLNTHKNLWAITFSSEDIISKDLEFSVWTGLILKVWPHIAEASYEIDLSLMSDKSLLNYCGSLHLQLLNLHSKEKRDTAEYLLDKECKHHLSASPTMHFSSAHSLQLVSNYFLIKSYALVVAQNAIWTNNMPVVVSISFSFCAPRDRWIINTVPLRCVAFCGGKWRSTQWSGSKMPRRAVYLTIKMAGKGENGENTVQDWENVHEMAQKMEWYPQARCWKYSHTGRFPASLVRMFVILQAYSAVRDKVS